MNFHIVKLAHLIPESVTQLLLRVASFTHFLLVNLFQDFDFEDREGIAVILIDMTD
jgi:hypothetical protein